VSVKVMSAVWERDDLDASERLVMLSLADHADDEGACYPSIKRLCERTSLAERTVQGTIKKLIGRGLLIVNYGAGRNGTNLFIVRAAPAADAPPQQMHPRKSRTTPPQMTAIPPAADAPKPSRTIIETSDNISAREVASVLEVHASSQAVASFIAYRKKSKGKALTLTAAKRLANNLRAIAERGGDPDDALGMAEERVWLTVEPDWYFNSQGKQHGNGSRSVSQDPTLRAIFAAAGAFKA
jgi:hypothetical protein